MSLDRSDFAIANHFPFARGYGFIISVSVSVLFVPLGSDRLITSDGDVFKVRVIFVLFVPFGFDRLITLNGDVFKVRG
jgi:hypothetical protein